MCATANAPFAERFSPHTSLTCNSIPSAGYAFVELSDNSSDVKTTFSRASTLHDGAVNASTQALFNAERLFRIASISKSVTATATMMLVERGSLNLSDPVNLHLPAELEFGDDDRFGVMRVQHLLTHTAGLDESVVGQVAVDWADFLDLKEYLVRVKPARVFPVGVVPSYSNYGKED